MQIEPQAPFRISNEKDGTKHAIKNNIQISVFPDVKDVKIKHRVAQKPMANKESRWLYITIGDLKLYINGTHVLITHEDLVPTFPITEIDEYVEEIIKRLRVTKDEKGRYIVKNPKNKAMVKKVLEVFDLDSRKKALDTLKCGQTRNLSDGFND